MKIAASIILYHPEISVLQNNIDAIISHIDVILLWHNSKELISISPDKKIVHLGLGDNEFIAKPLNRCLEYCQDHNIDYLLTMDQDSIFENFEAFLQNAFKYITPHTIICAPNIKDMYPKTSNSISVQYAFTSGSLCNVPACIAVGGFREDYKIDYVDAEFCHWAIKCGYQIIALPYCKLEHNLGGNYPPLRYYFMFRNMILMRREYKTIPSIKMMVHTTYYTLSGIFHNHVNVAGKFRASLKGIFSGLFSNISTPRL